MLALQTACFAQQILHLQAGLDYPVRCVRAKYRLLVRRNVSTMYLL